MFDWFRGDDGESDSEEYNFDRQKTVPDFESLLSSDGITVEGNREEIVEKFDDIVARYNEISPEIKRAHEEIGEGEKVTLLGEFEQLPEWQEENQCLVTEIESLWDQFQQLIQKIEWDESKFEEDPPSTEIDSFSNKLSDAKNLILERD